MNRVLLLRRGDGTVGSRELDDAGATVEHALLPAAGLAGFVREREAAAPVRWVWDDTTRWYPSLLQAGVRVERCTDLRLSHAVLRRSPFVDQVLLTGGDTAGWDALLPVTGTDAALFPLEDPADRLDPVAEDARQRAALAASSRAGRLARLLAAESSGALVAAEMTCAGFPWRADVHDRLLTELLVTGRWASHGGGALSVPVQVRPAAIADEGWRFVVADVAQLEPRVLAGMSRDSAMADAARSADLYAGMVAGGAVASRADAKVGMLGAMYGATRGESGRMLPRLARRYPRAVGLVEEAARAGERGEVVHTQLGRGSPPPTGAWAERAVDLGEPAVETGSREDRDRHRRARGRFTRNFVVQGTGAEWTLCWLADLRNRLWRLTRSGRVEERPHLVFFLHDEVVVHTPEALAAHVVEQVRQAAVTAGRLLFGEFPVDFPLDVSVVRSWADAG